MTDKFENCEQELISRLQNLPEVKPDREFQERLGERLLAGHQSGKKFGRERHRPLFVRFGIAAAAVLFLLTGLFTFLYPREDGDVLPGPLFLSAARAGAAGAAAPEITLGNGIDSLRQVRFQVKGDLPAAEEEGMVLQFKHGQMTKEQVFQLARRLGMKDPEVRVEGEIASVSGAEESLLVWLNLGSWLYQRSLDQRTSEEPEVVKQPGLTSEEMARAALNWLESAGLLPEENYSVIQNPADERQGLVTVRMKTAPGGLPIIGSAPEIRVIVGTDSEIVEAYGTWYLKEEVVKARLENYEEALGALQRGEGVFEAKNFQPFQPGTAVVEGVQIAYQLAYAIDFTPYLVPAAVFQGKYTPQGGASEDFTAYVSLLKNNKRHNSGNFTLATELPAAPASAPVVFERDNAVTTAELPALAAFFGIKGEPDEDGTIRSSEGEISPTSWDGGWLYRSPQIGQSQRTEVLIDEAKILEIAGEQTARLPLLPGKPGEPKISSSDPEAGIWVTFPLLYGEIPVISFGPPGYVSSVGVQLGPTGEIWSVKCAHPMKLAAEKKPLLSPKQAWEQLMANNSEIHVDGFFGTMPGDLYFAGHSRITEAKLVYVPRRQELIRNENYDLKYMFKGNARVGSRDIKFTALVEAVSK